DDVPGGGLPRSVQRQPDGNADQGTSREDRAPNVYLNAEICSSPASREHHESHCNHREPLDEQQDYEKPVGLADDVLLHPVQQNPCPLSDLVLIQAPVRFRIVHGASVLRSDRRLEAATLSILRSLDSLQPNTGVDVPASAAPLIAA